jgi:sugar lactone lactonase YvrE
MKIKAIVAFLFVGIICCNYACKKKRSTIPTTNIIVTTVAGTGGPGSTNGPALSATFHGPNSVAVDSKGNIYVADYLNYLIRKISRDGIVSTLAGSGMPGNSNGNGTAASFNLPRGIAVDANGNVYVADSFNNLIRKITPTGNVSTFAGSGIAGSDNGLATQASFRGPAAITIDKAGYLYVCEPASFLVRKISPDGLVSNLAGTGSPGETNGPALSATFDSPLSIAIDTAGNIYVSEFPNELIRKISAAGIVSTLAGSGQKGDANGAATAASFNYPQGLATDTAGNIYVADMSNKIRKITSDGMVSTLAGTGLFGAGNGPAASASFDRPAGLATDEAGNIYVADYGNNLIRKIAVR